MIELSVIRDLVAIFGVLAGFSYYVLTVRNTRKSQRLVEDARQIQSISDLLYNEEDMRPIIELINMEWSDYEDFEMKYGSDNNPDNYAKRVSVWGRFNNLGYMLKNGLIKREAVFELSYPIPMVLWVKYHNVIKEIRRRYNQPIFMIYFEYLVEEFTKYLQEKGIDTMVPETFFRYIPDQ